MRVCACTPCEMKPSPGAAQYPQELLHCPWSSTTLGLPAPRRPPMAASVPIRRVCRNECLELGCRCRCRCRSVKHHPRRVAVHTSVHVAWKQVLSFPAFHGHPIPSPPPTLDLACQVGWGGVPKPEANSHRTGPVCPCWLCLPFTLWSAGVSP